MDALRWPGRSLSEGSEAWGFGVVEGVGPAGVLANGEKGFGGDELNVKMLDMAAGMDEHAQALEEQI